MTFAQSVSCQSILHSLQTLPDLAESLDLFVADNSPEPQPIPADFPGTYLYDGSNPGLAKRYNTALALARATGATWLLLFDQDTSPTPDYFAELLNLSRTVDASVAAIVPKLIMDGRILSPHPPRYRETLFTITDASSGILSDAMRAFNSGALIRVSTLDAIGGFPQEFWLDYLDHATFHRIQAAGGKMYVMRSAFAHELSDARPEGDPDPVRLLNHLKAQLLYYRLHGTWQERLTHRFDLLRQIVGWGRRGYFAQTRTRLRAFFTA